MKFGLKKMRSFTKQNQHPLFAKNRNEPSRQGTKKKRKELFLSTLFHS